MFIDIPDCVLSKMAANTSFRNLVLMSRTNKSLNQRMKHILADLGARRIQKFWRWCRYASSLKVVVRRFQLTQLHSTKIRYLSFDDFQLHSESPWVVSACSLFIERIYTLSKIFLGPNFDGAIDIPFLGSDVVFDMFVIKFYYYEILDYDGEIEFNLRRSADDMCLCIERIVDHVAAGGAFIDVGEGLAAGILISVSKFVHLYNTCMYANPGALYRQIEDETTSSGTLDDSEHVDSDASQEENEQDYYEENFPPLGR